MGWSYSGVAVNVALQLAASVVFARLLGAHTIGVFAFGLLVFPPFRFICEFGLGSALVQKQDLASVDVELALSRSVILALITAAAWVLCVHALAPSMHQQQYAPALSCFALVLLCLPLQTLCTAVLTRKLEQKYLQISSLVGYAAGYLSVGVYGALHEWGVWSLMLGFLAQNLIATAILLVHTRLELRLRLKGDAGFLWRFGARAAAINISNWLTSSLDNMAVAWFFGTRPLGVYSVAYGLVRAPADRIVTTLQNVLFPASVLARNDTERLAKGCIAVIDATFLIVAPAFCAVAILSVTIIDALYGSDWRQAAWLLPPLALSMIFHCLTVVVSALLWGSGGVNRDLRIQWCSAAAFLIGVLLAGRVSLVAVAWTVLPVTVLRAAWGMSALVTTVGIAPRRLLSAFLSGLILAALIAPALFWLDGFFQRALLSSIARLSWDVVAAALAWLGLAALLRARIMTPELQTGLRSMLVALKEKHRA